MRTVELEEYIFQIVCIVRRNSHHNSNFFYQFKNSNDFQYIYVILKFIFLTLFIHPRPQITEFWINISGFLDQKPKNDKLY
jgi:hypothetical protein